MPVTLAQAKLNTTDDLDLNVIDEFSTSSLIDALTFDDCVNPIGGGDTITYTYTRKASLGTASFRAINSEYIPNEASKVRASVDLKVLGGSYQIDRVLARFGPAATGEIMFQMKDKIQAAKATFSDGIINGDSSANADSFDGLSKILAGTSTEVVTPVDWTGTMNEDKSYAIMDDLDTFLALLDGQPGALITNKKAIAKIKAALRRSAQYVEKPGPLNTIRSYYGSIELVDAGQKAGTNTDIIPVTAGVTQLYAVRYGLDGFHGVSGVGGDIVRQWLPDFSVAGAVKTGEVEMGPVAVVLKKTKAAGVLRSVKVSA